MLSRLGQTQSVVDIQGTATFLINLVEDCTLTKEQKNKEPKNKGTQEQTNKIVPASMPRPNKEPKEQGIKQQIKPFARIYTHQTGLQLARGQAIIDRFPAAMS
jgi:hypothetical protein